MMLKKFIKIFYVLIFITRAFFSCGELIEFRSIDEDNSSQLFAYDSYFEDLKMMIKAANEHESLVEAPIIALIRLIKNNYGEKYTIYYSNNEISKRYMSKKSNEIVKILKEQKEDTDFGIFTSVKYLERIKTIDENNNPIKKEIQQRSSLVIQCSEAYRNKIIRLLEIDLPKLIQIVIPKRPQTKREVMRHYFNSFHAGEFHNPDRTMMFRLFTEENFPVSIDPNGVMIPSDQAVCQMISRRNERLNSYYYELINVKFLQNAVSVNFANLPAVLPLFEETPPLLPVQNILSIMKENPIDILFLQERKKCVIGCVIFYESNRDEFLLKLFSDQVIHEIIHEIHFTLHANTPTLYATKFIQMLMQNEAKLDKQKLYIYTPIGNLLAEIDSKCFLEMKEYKINQSLQLTIEKIKAEGFTVFKDSFPGKNK